ncbi:MAG: 30S ribosome-binding factor RbfA [Bacteroidota bacterium]
MTGDPFKTLPFFVLLFIFYLCAMESTRQQKIARLIQKEMGVILQQESRNLFGGALITVTKVQVTKDLAIARVNVSLFGVKDKNVLLEKIRHHTRELRHHLVRRIHDQLRIMPDLQFYLDDSLDYIDNIDHLLKDG